MRRRTQVAIVGAGPAGLLLAHLLESLGIDSVVLEKRSRAHVESRLRAGVLEQGTVDLLRAVGVSDGVDRRGLVQQGIELRFDGESRRVPLAELTGRPMTVYGQRELVCELIASWLGRNRELVFEAEDVTLCGLLDGRPSLHYRHGGEEVQLDCDVVAGCDGFHGVSARTVPGDVRRVFERDFGLAWLGILAQVAPSYPEAVYASTERGFALGSSRSPQVSRLYVECAPTDTVDDWPDARVWDELALRLATEGFELAEGPVLEKDISRVRAHVSEPMRYGRLLLAGDAAHVFPPTGAKGLNAAASDVAVLAECLERWYAGDSGALEGYSQRCLRRAWRVQEFAADLTAALHVGTPGSAWSTSGFDRRLQRAAFERVTTGAGARAFAEEYVGLPW